MQSPVRGDPVTEGGSSVLLKVLSGFIIVLKLPLVKLIRHVSVFMQSESAKLAGEALYCGAITGVCCSIYKVWSAC